MATYDRIKEVAEGIAADLEQSPHIKSINVGMVNREVLEYGDGVLTLSSLTDSLRYQRSSPQQVEWDLGIVLTHDLQSSADQAEKALMELLASNSDDSIFGILRARRRSSTDKYGSPMFEDVQILGGPAGDQGFRTFIAGKVVAQI